MNASAGVSQVLASEVQSAEAEYRRLKRRESWRRRILPCVGILVGLGVWAALVHVFKVPPFIAVMSAALMSSRIIVSLELS